MQNLPLLSYQIKSAGIMQMLAKNKQTGKIRIAQCDSLSLNDVLLKGPDLNNGLMGAVICLWSDPNAVMWSKCFTIFWSEKTTATAFLWFKDREPRIH